MSNKVFLASAIANSAYASLMGLPHHVVQIDVMGVAPTKKDFTKLLVGTAGFSEKSASDTARTSRVNDSFRTWVDLIDTALVSISDQCVYVMGMSGGDVYRVSAAHQVTHIATRRRQDNGTYLLVAP